MNTNPYKSPESNYAPAHEAEKPLKLKTVFNSLIGYFTAGLSLLVLFSVNYFLIVRVFYESPPYDLKSTLGMVLFLLSFQLPGLIMLRQSIKYIPLSLIKFKKILTIFSYTSALAIIVAILSAFLGLS